MKSNDELTTGQRFRYYAFNCRIYLTPFDLLADCGHPGNVANAYLHITKTTAGGVVTYTCNAGYAHTAGSMSRTCQSNKIWTGSKPTCSCKLDLPTGT